MDARGHRRGAQSRDRSPGAATIPRLAHPENRGSSCLRRRVAVLVVFAASSCAAFGQSSTTATTPTTVDPWCSQELAAGDHVLSAVEELSKFLVDPQSLSIYDVRENLHRNIGGVSSFPSTKAFIAIDYGARDKHGTLGRYEADIHVSLGLTPNSPDRCVLIPFVWTLDWTTVGVGGGEAFVEKGSWPTVPTTVDPRSPLEICDVRTIDLTLAQQACLERLGVFHD